MGEMSFPPDLRRWIDFRLAGGRYADAEDYIRDLIRRDQDGLLPEGDEDAVRLREQIADGFASGIVDAEPEDVLKEIMARLPNG